MVIEENFGESPRPKATSVRPYHVERLDQELLLRKRKNPSYSLRAFAHHLKLDPAALSRILSGKQDLSLRATQKIVLALGFDREERRKFQSSVAESLKEKATRFLHDSLSDRPSPREGKSSARISSPLSRQVIRVDSQRFAEASELVRAFALSLEKVFGTQSCEGRVEIELRQLGASPSDRVFPK